MNLEEHLKRQIAFSQATFGPGKRIKGIVDHIRKELVEVEQEAALYEQNFSPFESLISEEWVDVVILALDGLTRSLKTYDTIGANERTTHKRTTDEVAKIAAQMIVEKQNINENRVWPDWRNVDKETAIEHKE